MEKDEIANNIKKMLQEIQEIKDIIKMYEAKIRDATEISNTITKSLQEICYHRITTVFRGDASIGEQDYTECRICGKVLK